MMAHSQQQHAVKSLNTASVGRRRFVFKTFSQRVEEIDINVFRSLEPVKAQPSSGSSFFLETLVQWRELNTAEHFISFYVEMMPSVQTLPQVLLNAEKIFSELLARLNMDARLSLEPILSLIAALARDILELFKDLMPQLVVSLVDLLKNGADRDPEILEQVFTSWSYIVMHLQKYLTRDVSDVLEKTLLLRFYTKDYVQEFVAESIAFLLRNAPIDQLYKGIKKSLLEVAVSESTVNARRNGVVAMLFHTMRGSSARLHSRAERVLCYLVDKSNFIIPEGPQAIADVITGVIDRLCTEINPKELKVVFNCFFRSMSDSMKEDCLVHLKHLLDLITFTISKGIANFDRKIMLEFISMLTKSYMKPPDGANSEDLTSEVTSSILQLMLSLLDILVISDDLSKILLLYRPAFDLGGSHVLTFIRGIIDKDLDILKPFQTHILSAMDDMIEDSPEEVLFLMYKFFEKRSIEHATSVPSGIQDKVRRICKYAEKTILHWTEVLSDGATHHDKVSEVSVLWGVLGCYYQFQVLQDDFTLIKKFISTLDQLLLTEADEYLTIPKSTWQNLLGVALTSYGKMLQNSMSASSESIYFILLAKKHKSSPHVLSAVADFLDCVLGGGGYLDTSTVQELCHNALDSIAVFADNLRLPNKTIRIFTLRILSHYGPLANQLSNERPLKRLRIEESGSDFQDNHVIDILLSIEKTPLSISTSHKFNLLISKLQRALSSGKISASYISLLLSGIIGTLHNRFGHMWDPSLECLATLVGSYKDLVWSKFAQYLGDFQSRSLSSSKDAHKVYSGNPRSIGLIGCFNSFLASENDNTPCATVVTLLLKSLNKIPHVAESRSKELVPLFLKFMGYDNGIVVSIESYNKDCCKGMDWKDILKEWLSLLGLMHNARSFCQSHTLKKVLEERLLPSIDPDIQSKVLDCLLNWKDDYLMPYSHHLKNLIVSKNLREELTSWPISRESENIQEEHRCHLIPVVIKILIPKVQNLKTLGSRKHTGLSYRRAVLCSLSQLDVEELHFFFSLLLKPLVPNFPGAGVLDFGNVGALEDVRDQMQMSSLVNFSMIGSVSDISWKKTNGFLHVVEDILGTFDELRLKPYLSLLLMIVVHILERCMLDLASSKKDKVSIENFGDSIAASPATDEASQLVLNSTVVGDENPQFGVANFADSNEDYSSAKRIKDMRSLCLKIVSTSLSNYESDYFGSDFWKVFFCSIKPLIVSFKQEGSSSAKPSSLFSCFLAMSRSFELAKLLEWEPDLVPNIFSMLTVRTATEAVLSSVLDFVENLLKLENDSSNEGNSLKLVSPHLEVLIHSFHVLLQSRKEHHGRKSKVWLEKELRILKLLAKYINDCSVGGQFLDILLQLFKRMDANTDECLDALHVVKVILPLVKSPETSSRIVCAIHPLLIAAGMEPRTCICDILDGLKSDDPSLDILATYLRALNAISSTQIGEPDYDTRVTAYQEVKEELFLKLREEHALVILSQCIHDMSSGELIFRQSASSALFSFVKFAGSVLNGYKEDSSAMPSDDSEQNKMKSLTIKQNDNEVPTWTISSIQLIVKKSIMHHMGEAMNKYSSIQEWVSVLRELVYNLQEIPYLKSLRPLLSEDPEVDFFKNIIHLQVHRRRRALSRFRDIISLGSLAEDVSVKIFVPMFYNMLFDVKDGKGEDLRNACLETLASITRYMSWQSYRTFLMRCFREMVLKPDRQKILLRLICAVIETFHFFCVNSSEVREGNIDLGTSDYNLRDLSNGLPTTSTGLNVPYEIQAYLQKSVVPKIQKLLKSDSDKVNVTINLALLKLLKLMPCDTMDSHLSSIIHRICGFLKHHLESVRGEARSALAACLKELGLEYLHVVVKVLQAILKRGYELHVFGYTLNFILSKSLVPSAVGKLDHCLGELLSVVENDILGNVAQEKEVDKIASKMKETRKNKSFETLKLISQYITFQAHAKELLLPINLHLQKHLTPKIKAKLEMMLHHIALGIECNPSASSSELFVFVHCLMKDTVTSDGSHGKETTIAGSREKSVNSHLISVFALEVLHNRLKNINLNKKDEQLLSMLDPFVELLGYFLSSKYENVLSATFRCLILLVKLPLPSLEAQSNIIKTSLLEIAQKSGNANASLVQSCLKLLAFLLRSNIITLSNDQLRMLIQFPLFLDIQTKPSPIALSLLKSIVARKLVVYELYDIVMRVSELMVTSHSEPIRKKCSQILLQFLLDYRPSTKRLEQYMHFLLNNLSYEYSSGREAVLEMLRAILVKFPESFVDSHAQTIFVQLVVSLANESDSKIKDMISAVIKSLIEKISHHQLRTILDFSLQWYKSDKRHLWSASAQVLGLLVEVFRDGFQNYNTDVLKVAMGILKVFSEVKFSNNLELPFWKEAYHTLIMVKNILHQFPGLYFDREQEGIWLLVCRLLLHQHVLVRNTCTQLVASYFSAMKSQDSKLYDGRPFLCCPGRLFFIAVLLLNQLKSQLNDDAETNLLTQNLAFIVCQLHSFAEQAGSLNSYWSSIDDSERDSCLEGFNLLGSRKAKSAFLLYTDIQSQLSEEKDQMDQNDASAFHSLLIVPIIRKMGKIALEMQDIQMKVAFNCFKMISVETGIRGHNLYAIHMLLPLYKICEGFAGKVVTDESKQLAEEVRDRIRDFIGVETFIKLYHSIGKSMKEKRDKRKHEQKLIAATDPQRHAKRKLRIAAKHRDNKRRKIIGMKMTRWRR